MDSPLSFPLAIAALEEKRAEIDAQIRELTEAARQPKRGRALGPGKYERRRATPRAARRRRASAPRATARAAEPRLEQLADVAPARHAPPPEPRRAPDPSEHQRNVEAAIERQRVQREARAARERTAAAARAEVRYELEDGMYVCQARGCDLPFETVEAWEAHRDLRHAA